MVTVVPFYHGANRYLDATYVTKERYAKRYALMVDFIALLLWNIFRNCCPSDGETHCYNCDKSCSLPKKFGQISGFEKCLFSEICLSVGKSKIKEPAYSGHYY